MSYVTLLEPEKSAARKQETKTNTIHVGEAPKNLSFSGCGFLGVYHIGVASCLRTHASTLINNLDKIYGCSAGSMIGAMLLVDVSFGEVCQHTMELVTQARSGFLGPLSPKFKLNDILLENLREKLPADAHLKTTGKLHISLTRVRDGKNVIVSDYATREELIQVLLCSCFVPFYSGIVPPTYRNVYYIDGGLSNNLPADNETITVSPWSGSSDICPRDDEDVSLIDFIVTNTSIQATPSNLYRCSTMFFPPHPKILRDFCSQGFQETAQYLQDHGLFESTPALRKNKSFSVGLKQTQKRRAMTRHMSVEGSLKNFRRKTMSESAAVALDNSNEEKRMNMENDASQVAAFTLGREEVDNIFESEEEEQLLDPDVLTVVHEYPIEIQKQLLQLHMILPQPVLDALEQAFVIGTKGEKKILERIVDACRNSPLVRIPVDRSYQIARALLRKSHYLPAEVTWMINHLKGIVTELHRHFRCKGDELVCLLRRLRSRMFASVQLLAERLSLAVLLLTRKLLELGCPYVPGMMGASLLKFFDAVEGLVVSEFLPMLSAH